MTTEHPDHEQLAAFQAGDGDRRQRADVEAHLAGCPSCRELVASVDRARGRLALLGEPDLPPGLHDRLAAAVEAAAAEDAGAAARPASRLRRPALRPASDGSAARAGAGRQAGGRSGGRGRPVPWYRRPVAWGAAAALLLAALLLAALVAVPLLDRSTELSTASGGAGGGQAAPEAGDAAAGGAGDLPVLRIPGEVTAAAIRARLATDHRARSALEGGAPLSPPGTQPAAPGQSQQGADSTGGGFRSSAPTPQTGSASVPACLVAATAAANPAIRPLNPAFFVEGTYKGRQATVLVTTSSAQPGRADLWVFPRDDCSSAPLATDRLR